MVRAISPGARTRIGVALLLLAGVLVSLTRSSPTDAAPLLPPGFSTEQIVSLNGAIFTNFAFAPDGRIFIADKAGIVRVVQGGALLPTPFIDISADVNNYFEHGMTGLALDPGFPAKPYVYVLYVHDPSGATKDVEGTRFARIERITANASNTNVAASTGARTVLFGGAASMANIGSSGCVVNGTPVQDCIPVDSYRHATGDLRFGPDGALYAGIGDGDRNPSGPQSPTLMTGKVFRINPTNGQGYTDNPFYNGSVNANVSKVFSLGHRNPWRISFHPTSGEMMIGDVGESQWEALYRGVKGTNYGWPCREAGSQPFGIWAATGTCQNVYANVPSVTPAYQYNHNGLRSSVTGGAWYLGTSYPAAYQDAFFWGDYGRGTLEVMKRSGNGYRNESFGTGFGGNSIVSFAAGPGGDIYLMTIGGFNTSNINGTIWRLRYTAAGNRPPTAVASANAVQGSAPLAVSYTGSGSVDPDGNSLSYSWDFGDGSSATTANPTHTYTANGNYTARLTVRDPAGASDTTTMTIRVGPVPVVTMTSPASAITAHLGDSVTFAATATDPKDGDVSSQIHWSSRLFHGSHLHPDPISTTPGPSVTFAVGDHDDDIRYELCAHVTNSTGITSDEVCQSVSVRMAPVTLTSSPPGLTLTIGGITQVTPISADVNIGATRTLAAAPQTGCSQFVSWSDGGAATHAVTVTGPATYTATYAPIPGCVTAGDLRISEAATRAPSTPLTGSVLPLTGDRYIFFEPNETFTSVRFWIDNPGMTGAPFRVENTAPWDLNGGAATATALPLSSLTAGNHLISVSATRTNGTIATTSAGFAVGGTTGTPQPGPPTTPPATPPTTVASGPPTTPPSPSGSAGELRISEAPTRAPSSPLAGGALPATGNRYIFLETTTAFTGVRFWLDNAAMTGPPFRVEGTAPWDFNGGAVTATAFPLSALAAGSHLVSVQATRADGTTATAGAAFTIGGSAPPAATTTVPAPPPTTAAGPPTTVAPIGPLPGTPGAAWVETGGQVTIEAEQYDGRADVGARSWTLINGAGGASGQMVQSLPNTGLIVTTNIPTSAPRVDYRVQFSTPGTYHVWLRGLGDADPDNSVHFGLNGAVVDTADNATTVSWGTLVWSKQTQALGPVATVTIPSAGIYTLNMWMREDGFRVDRLLLTTDATFVPSDIGPDSSPRSG